MNDLIVFTKKYEVSSFDGFLITDEAIINDNKLIPIKALWDTGSSESVISNNLANKLNLCSIGSALLNGTSLSCKTNIYEVVLLLAKKQQIILHVTGSSQIGDNNIDLLIGLDVISMCDFVISTDNKNLCMSVRFPSQGSIDFTKDC
jgi:hypothetical protein